MNNDEYFPRVGDIMALGEAVMRLLLREEERPLEPETYFRVLRVYQESPPGTTLEAIAGRVVRRDWENLSKIARRN